MRKICTILLMSMMALWAIAQSNYFFDMDALVASEGLYLPQNKPNPFNGSTDIYLAVVDKAEVSLVAADVYGHIEAQYRASLKPGVHRFRITLRGKGIHVLGVHQSGKSRSIVLLCNTGGTTNCIDYCEFVESIDLALYEELLSEDKEEDFVAYGAVKTAKHSNAEYDKAVTKAKIEWLKKHLPSVHFTNIYIVAYGTPKQTLANGILFDDEEPNRKAWGEKAYNATEIMETLKGLM